MYKLFFIIFIFLLSSCSPHQQETKEAIRDHSGIVTLTAEQVANAGIVTDSVSYRSMNTELHVNGVVDVPPQNIVSISFPLGGYLKSTELLPGMHVNKGQVIARVEDPALVQIQQDYLVAIARMQYLEQEYQRQKLLNEQEVSATKIFQQTRAEYATQKILVKGLSEKLRLISIRPESLHEENISRSVAVYSPISGFVSKVNVNIGKYVNPADVLFELINPDDLHATLTVFEKDLTAVHPRQKVKVSFVENPENEYECEVLLVTKNVDDNRSALVHCHFETQPKQLLPGMFLNARIMVKDATVLAVPEAAVVRYGASEYIFESLGGNKFKRIEVKTGMLQDGLIAIRQDNMDLEGKIIVVKNTYSILSQMMNIADES
ncbi:MAG: efflux RND transporter periplasmic adaptor subunit [Terrimonas sp.]|nr:efflux RND transporter periplasmic adaptor subunit [Terrimonas sp.]